MDRVVYLGLLDAGLIIAALLIIFRRININKKWLVILASFVFIINAIDVLIVSSRLWQEYQADPIKQYWLPPHSNLVYVHIWRLFIPLVAALTTAVLVFIILWWLKRRFSLVQYGTDDVYLLTIAALVSGWPGFFITFIAIFVAAVIGTFIIHLARTTPSPPLDPAQGFEGRRPHPLRREKRIGQPIRLIITPFILPVTAVMIWVLPYLNQVTGLEKIRF